MVFPQIRSSYQGALFGFLKDQKTTKSIDTMKKMHEAGFTIYGDEDMEVYFTAMKEYGLTCKLVKAKDIEEYWFKTTDPNFKGAVPENQLSVAYFNEKNTKRNIRLYVAKEEIVQFYISMLLRKYSYLKVPVINQSILFIL